MVLVGDIIQGKNARRLLWRIVAINPDGTLEVEQAQSVRRGPTADLLRPRKTKTITRPEYYVVRKET